MNLTFSGSKVLILGGSCDIALDLILILKEYDLDLTLSYRSNEALEKIKMVTDQNVIKLDLEDKTTFSNLDGKSFDYVIDFLQSDYEALVSSSEQQEVENYFSTNLINKVEILKGVSRSMVLNKFGRLIFISSAATISPNQGQGFYASTKVAIEKIYQQMGIELGSKGITSLCLKVGYIDSGRGKIFASKNEKILRMIPTRKLLSNRELSSQITFFLSNEASYINATSITIDGGLNSTKYTK